MVKDKEFINEITFLRKDTLLIEGLGKRVAENGKLVFDQKSGIRYEWVTLVKSACK